MNNSPARAPSSKDPEQDLTTEIRQDLEQASLPASPLIVEHLAGYQNILSRWSRTYNLTAIRDPSRMRVQHLGDCIAVVPALVRHLPAGEIRVLDVGSGGGLPGIVLAILQPSWRVDCIDSVGKKAAFIRQAAGELGLSNVSAIHGRVESLARTAPAAYDLVISRAFSSLRHFVELTRPARLPTGIWAAMKGRLDKQELNDVPPDLAIVSAEPIKVRASDSIRHLVIVASKH